MTAKEALQNMVQVAIRYRGTREEHSILQRSLQLLAKLVEESESKLSKESTGQVREE